MINLGWIRFKFCFY